MMCSAERCDRIQDLSRLFRMWLAQVKVAYLDRKIGIETKEDGTITAYEPGSELPYRPTYYGRLEKMLRFLCPAGEDVFVDLGCGKGRAVFFVATHPLKKVIGVEINKKLYDAALQNAGTVKSRRAPVELIHADAADFDPKEGTIFFIFNSFGASVLEKVLANIQASLVSNPRKIRIVYYAPLWKALLEEQDWLEIAGEIENESCPVWESCSPGSGAGQSTGTVVGEGMGLQWE